MASKFASPPACQEGEPQRHAEAAVQLLASYCAAPYWQMVLGSEDVMYNPLPVVWAARSPHGNLVGMLSAVVWT